MTVDKVLKRRGHKEAFDERKLYASIYHPAREAGYDEQEAEQLAEDVSQTVAEWVREHEDNVLTSREVQERTEEVLAEKDENVSFLYETHLDLS